MIKIDKGIPLPKLANSLKGAIYPWASMEIGDSFFAAGTKHPSVKGLGKVFSSRQGKSTVPKSKWSTRTAIENGVSGIRCWRVA